LIEGKILALQKEVRNMLLVLLAKIIKTGWFDSDEDKNQE